MFNEELLQDHSLKLVKSVIESQCYYCTYLWMDAWLDHTLK